MGIGTLHPRQSGPKRSVACPRTAPDQSPSGRPAPRFRHPRLLQVRPRPPGDPSPPGDAYPSVGIVRTTFLLYIPREPARFRRSVPGNSPESPPGLPKAAPKGANRREVRPGCRRPELERKMCRRSKSPKSTGIPAESRVFAPDSNPTDRPDLHKLQSGSEGAAGPIREPKPSVAGSQQPTQVRGDRFARS